MLLEVTVPELPASSAATGRIDGMIFLLGVVFGIFAFGEVFPLVSNFYNSTPMGQVTLPEFFNIPYGVVVFLVVLMAVGAFAAAEWGEKNMAKKAGVKKSEKFNFK